MGRTAHFTRAAGKISLSFYGRVRLVANRPTERATILHRHRALAREQQRGHSHRLRGRPTRRCADYYLAWRQAQHL